MSEVLERLKEIGAQKISEDTHIPVEHIKAILNSNFEKLSKLQFLGFLSIIEREYSCDLSALRTRGIEYYDELKKNSDVTINEAIYKAPSNKKSFMFIYITIAIIIFIIAVIYSMDSENRSLQNVPSQNKIIEEVKQNIIPDVNTTESDENKSVATFAEQAKQDDEQNSTAETTEIDSAEQQDDMQGTIEHTFEIISKKRVWLGYIDITDHKRYQKTFQGLLKLDPAKEWLLYFGHGHVDVVIDNETEKFNDRNTLRLHYKDGNLRKITLQEFKRLNRGKKW